ncbi:hypothetical protein D9M68_1004230 [compost metagenome]
MPDDENAITAGAVDEKFAGVVGYMDISGAGLDAAPGNAVELGCRGAPVVLAIVQNLFKLHGGRHC